MVEITIKVGETFKKGKDFHRIDLELRKEIGNENYMEKIFETAFNRLEIELMKLKEAKLKDARI